jgi:hypothetical protein
VFYPATPREIDGLSVSRDLGAWAWEPLGRAWALQQQFPGSTVGPVTVALTGYAGGRPWAEDDFGALIDGYRVWMRGLVGGRVVLEPVAYQARDVAIFACGVAWTEARARRGA